MAPANAQVVTEETVPGGVDHEDEIPEDHPRYLDLVTRHRIEEGIEAGITHIQGMHAEGRGSAFDYLLGEETIPSADRAARVAAAELLRADHPVLSVNGNVAALVPEETVRLAETVDAAIEVNLFHRSEERIRRIIQHLEAHGAKNVLGLKAEAEIPGLTHDRAKVSAAGIGRADVVLVPLEDGDRAKALREMGIREIVIDLNPLSRSPRAAHVPIIDNVVRAMPTITEHAEQLADRDPGELTEIIEAFDPDEVLAEAERVIRQGGSMDDQIDP